MSLPSTWIDRIFQKLTIAYGRDFLDRWRDIDLDDVKLDWATELAGFLNRPEAIKHALDHLPDSKPPTVFEFRKLCINAPRPAGLEVGYSGSKPAQKIEIGQSKRGPKEWAYTLKARHDAGGKLNLYQIQCYKMALATDLGVMLTAAEQKNRLNFAQIMQKREDPVEIE